MTACCHGVPDYASAHYGLSIVDGYYVVMSCPKSLPGRINFHCPAVALRGDPLHCCYRYDVILEEFACKHRSSDMNRHSPITILRVESFDFVKKSSTVIRVETLLYRLVKKLLSSRMMLYISFK